MSDGKISEAQMLASLHDIELPAQALGGQIPELFMIIGIAGLSGMLLALLVRTVFTHSRNAGSDTQRRLRQIHKLPEPERRVALLHLLRDRAPDRYASYQDKLYHSDGGIDLVRLEREVRDLV